MSTSGIPLISIVVLSHNRRDDLQANLVKLLPVVRAERLEMIVVDNASTDGSVDIVRNLQQEWPEIILINNKDNLGPCGGRNSGFQICQGTYIICFDDDATMDIDQLLGIPFLFSKYPQAGILTFKVRQPNADWWECEHGPIPKRVANFHEAGTAYRREVFELSGYMDEDCLYGADGLDMSIRALAHGFETVYIPDICIIHNKLTRTDRIELSRRRNLVFCNTRVVAKHFPMGMSLANSFRIVTRYTLPTAARGNLFLAISLCMDGIQGWRAGRRLYRPLPYDALLFYKNSSLRPDYGNSPILLRLYDLYIRAVQAGRLTQLIRAKR